MRLNVFKYVYFFRQLSMTEFLTSTFDIIFARKELFANPRKRETLKFLEARYKDGIEIRRLNGLSVVTLPSFRLVYLRRFSSDVLAFNQIILKKEFENVITCFRENNFVPEYCIDGGANIGLTLLFLKSFYPDLNVIAVEPNEESLDVLRKNITDNQLESCQVVKGGIWSSAVNLSPSGSINDREMEWGFKLSENVTEQSGIQGHTIMQLVNLYRWPRIDFLKLDIEGAEKEIFKNPEVYNDFMRSTRSVSMEVHDPEYKVKIQAIMESYGMTVFEFGELTFGFKKTP